MPVIMPCEGENCPYCKRNDALFAWWCEWRGFFFVVAVAVVELVGLYLLWRLA